MSKQIITADMYTGSVPSVARTYREYLIYRLINDTENAMHPNPQDQLTMEQKKRLRRQIINAANALPLDAAAGDKESNKLRPGRIGRGFFDIPYVRELYGNDEAKISEARDSVMAKIQGSGSDSYQHALRSLMYTPITENGKTSHAYSGKFVISPYDPNFNGMSGFGSNDTLATAKKDPGKFSEPITRVNLQANGRNITTTKNGYNVYNSSDLSGFSSIAQYVNNPDLDSVRRKMEKDRREFGNISNIELETMTSILSYLDETGKDYVVRVNKNDGHLVARVGESGMEIRLLDRREPQYAGRIYDGRKNVYLSVRDRNSQVENAFTEGIVTPQDKVNMIRWYLGDDVERQEVDRYGRKPEETHLVGEVVGVQVTANDRSQYINGMAVDKNASVTLKTINCTKQNGEYSFKPTKKAQYIVPVNIMVNSSNPNYITDEDIFDNSIMNGHDVITESLVLDKLKEWIDSARDNFAEQVDVEGLLAAYHAHDDEAVYEFQFSDNDVISETQMMYWNLLNGSLDYLVSPLSEEVNAENPNEKVVAYFVNDEFSAEDIIVMHHEEQLNAMFGDIYNQFNPANVAQYVNTKDSLGVQRNQDYIRHMLNMVTSTDNLTKGDDYFSKQVKDESIKFNPDTAISLRDMMAREGTDEYMPFTTSMMNEVKHTLETSGCKVDDANILVDDNGIIRYSAVVAGTKTRSIEEKSRNVSGTLGQVFEPEEPGIIRTKYHGSDNKVIIPGYDAYLVPQQEGVPSDMKSRLRLRGFEQSMAQAIRQQVRSNVTSASANSNYYSTSTILNGVYHHIYETSFRTEEYDERMARGGKETESFIDVIKTLRGRCRFPNEYGEGATTTAQSMLDNPTEREARMFDYRISDLVDNKNLRVLDESFDGVFDADMTGTAKTQGLVRYLTDEAVVNLDGTVTPGPEDGQCAASKNEVFKNMYHDTWDRRLMAFTQFLTAKSTPRHVGMAMMNVEGLTFDDGYVVSKAFADKYGFIGENGVHRSLIKGDKLSDFHGNKGVISLVADPDMTIENISKEVEMLEDTMTTTDENGWNLKGFCEYRGDRYPVVLDTDEPDEIAMARQVQEQLGYGGFDETLKLFADNPQLDVVAAPYSGASRFNGGSVRTLMDDHDTLVINGVNVEGGMGYTDMIVVDMPVDVKTHFYDKSAIMAGRGRKASGQLAWALEAKGANAIMREFYGDNTKAFNNMREFMIAIGMDLSPTGEPLVSYTPQVDEQRQLFTIPSDTSQYKNRKRKTYEDGNLVMVDFNENKATGLVPLDDTDERSEFLEAINQSGGFLALPFQLDFKLAGYVGISEDDEMYRDFLTEETGYRYTDAVGNEHETYGMPVLSHYLRSGQDFEDGTAIPHDYTNAYLKIYRSAMEYRRAEDALLTETDDNRRENLMKFMEKQKKDSQNAFDSVVSDVVSHKFNTKYNMIREGIMSNRLDASATAVWSADPRLDINQIGMSEESMKQMGVKPGDYILVWRDPILHDGNVRYLQTVKDNTLTGVAVNPLIDLSFDGDFDGDSVALKKLHTKEAQDEAMRLFSIDSNLLNYGVGKSGEHPLYIQDGLDAASNAYIKPELKEQFDILTQKVNEFEMAVDKGQIVNADKIAETRKEFRESLNEWTHNSLAGIGSEHIIVKDAKSLVESVQHMVDNGSKGSYDKIENFLGNVGITYSYKAGLEDLDVKKDANGNAIVERIDLDTVKDIKVPDPRINGRDVDKKIQATAAYKADNTALGGVSAQNAVSALRNVDVKMATEMTYPITQAILQSKHDPKDAITKDKIVRFWGKNVWDGYKLTGDFGENVDAKTLQETPHKLVYEKNSKGNMVPVKCTKDEWILQMKGMMRALKVDINEEYIDKMADVMTDRSTSKVMGLTKYCSEFGTLLDKAGYKGKLSALYDAAMSPVIDGSGSIYGNMKSATAKFAPVAVQDVMTGKEQVRPFGRSDMLCKDDASVKLYMGMPSITDKQIVEKLNLYPLVSGKDIEVDKPVDYIVEEDSVKSEETPVMSPLQNAVDVPVASGLGNIDLSKPAVGDRQVNELEKEHQKVVEVQVVQSIPEPTLPETVDVEPPKQDVMLHADRIAQTDAILDGNDNSDSPIYGE